MKKIAFITTPDAEYGFSMTGAGQQTAEEARAAEALDKSIAEPEMGLIVLDERLLGAVSEERFRELEKDWRGILLVLPTPVKPPEEAEDYAARLIRRAIGYHVRLKL